MVTAPARGPWTGSLCPFGDLLKVGTPVYGSWQYRVPAVTAKVIRDRKAANCDRRFVSVNCSRRPSPVHVSLC